MWLRQLTSAGSPLHCPSLNRSLCRRHVAECAGRVELLQTAVSDCRAGRAGQWADDADLRHSLHAAAPPGPPVCPAAAVRQTAELRQQRRSHVELHRTFTGTVASQISGCLEWRWAVGLDAHFTCSLFTIFRSNIWGKFLRLGEVCEVCIHPSVATVKRSLESRLFSVKCWKDNAANTSVLPKQFLYLRIKSHVNKICQHNLLLSFIFLVGLKTYIFVRRALKVEILSVIAYDVCTWFSQLFHTDCKFFIPPLPFKPDYPQCNVAADWHQITCIFFWSTKGFILLNSHMQ